MANSFAADFAEIWSRVQQEQFFKETVAVAIADTSVKSQMSRGDTFNKPYRSENTVQTYTRGTSITIDDKTDTQEQLVVNSEYATGFYIDDFDMIQSNYDLIAAYAKDDTDLLNIKIDADVMGEYTNAVSTVDDGDIGGVAGNGITLATNNVSKVFGAAHKKLAKQNVPLKRKFAVLSPEFEDILVQYGAGRDTASGDRVQDNGFIGKFYGFDLFMSNNLAGSAVLALATNPTNADTITVDGITFTFVSSIGSTAGNVLIAGSVDGTRANLVNLINDPSTTDANQVGFSGENLRKIQNNWSASNDDTADTATIVVKGAGSLVVSETLTDGTDAWDSAPVIHANFGEFGAIEQAIQENVSTMVTPREFQLGDLYKVYTLSGVKTFNEGADRFVDVQLA